jgi:hypothetical protein
MRVCVCVRAQAAHLASVRALQTERSVTHTIELADLHTYGSSTDRLHRAMAAMQSPRSQTAYVRLQRPVSRDANFNSARPSPVLSVNRHRLGTYSSTPPVKEVLYQPSRDDRVRKLLDPTVREHNHGRAYELQKRMPLCPPLQQRFAAVPSAISLCCAQLLGSTHDQALAVLH